MPDFAREFGANAPFVQEIYDTWRRDPAQVAADWAEYFTGLDGQAATPSARTTAGPVGRREPLRGVALRIARNMEASREIPTATSVRTVPVKLLEENRALLNRHLAVMGRPKASFNHLIAYAFTRALAENPSLNAAFVEEEGHAVRLLFDEIHLGVAVDLVAADGSHTLLVPNVKNAGALGFGDFLHALSDLLARARSGKLSAQDFAGTTVTLTNPGTLGTSASIPRLMPGQGLILAAGAINWPTGYAFAAPEVMTELGIAKVMTLTSTYDHRIIQGAESGALLARIDGLLQGEDGFYDTIFADVACPYLPHHVAKDHPPRLVPGGALKAAAAEAQVLQLIQAYRTRGCRIADLDPLQFVPRRPAELSLEHYGLSIWDLDRTFVTGGLGGREHATLREILDILQETYCRKIGAEIMHLSDLEQRAWLQNRMEPTRNLEAFTPEEQARILDRLNAAEAFEKFLHARYVGQKRFSLEGAEVLIPLLDELLTRALDAGIGHVVMGMAHRGRLNVLVNVVQKPLEKVFSEFEGLVDPASVQGSGDVKYHVGAVGAHVDARGRRLPITLASNPSHLEAVNPVVEGIARALQDAGGPEGPRTVLPLLIHGDAAFAGQGVVAETLNMCQLAGYRTGGTVHVVINNQIGYTAGPRATRSTHFCTDMAKSVEAPILHVNGDFPESVLRAVRVALDYRQRFQHDVVIDLVCYRRWGHNETDEPAYTQPLLYRRIARQPSVRERYGRLLVQRQQLAEADREAASLAFEVRLRATLEAVRALPPPPPAPPPLEGEDPRDVAGGPGPSTGVPLPVLRRIVARATEPPPGHHVHPNLVRQLARRVEMLEGRLPVDWGCAEALALGSLLLEGVPVRLAGQDSGRGTFSQRHAVLRDQEDETDFVPLAHLDPTQARFEVHDSLLSEEAALAFEYGYATAASSALVLWEAQFGDFANGAQIPIDQFIASSEAKWGLLSGIVLLLPHGHDGQGPEHSSARPERFLQLCAEGNMTVANCSTAAQYFHLLRRQGRAAPKRPLVILTPKSLLKRREAASPIAAFTDGRFHLVIPEREIPEPDAATRVLLASGKIVQDLRERREALARRDVAIVRIEQLYPFPREDLRQALAEHPASRDLVWIQEEPQNQGAWSFLEPRLRAMGLHPRVLARRPASAPATGSLRVHEREQARLLEAAFAT